MRQQKGVREAPIALLDVRLVVEGIDAGREPGDRVA